MALDVQNLPASAFVELPGLRGLRVARIGQSNGASLEIVDAVKGVIIPAMAHPSHEQGRVLRGRLRFMKDGIVRELTTGDVWDVQAGETQGPHVVLEEDTRVAILRDGRSSFDVV